MVSLELARKLKDAGLKWEPKSGDSYWDDNEPMVFCGECNHYCIKDYENVYFAPSLSQLLEEITKREYVVASWFNHKGAEFQLFQQMNLLDDGTKSMWRVGVFSSESYEDAAAEALIWILEREKDDN